jgi:hypothetical protein
MSHPAWMARFWFWLLFYDARRRQAQLSTLKIPMPRRAKVEGGRRNEEVGSVAATVQFAHVSAFHPAKSAYLSRQAQHLSSNRFRAITTTTRFVVGFRVSIGRRCETRSSLLVPATRLTLAGFVAALRAESAWHAACNKERQVRQGLSPLLRLE